MPQEKRPWYDSTWSWWASAALALVMVAEYTRLVLTTDDSLRKIIALTIWVVLLILWSGRAKRSNLGGFEDRFYAPSSAQPAFAYNSYSAPVI